MDFLKSRTWSLKKLKSWLFQKSQLFLWSKLEWFVLGTPHCCKASGRLKTTRVMQTLSGLAGRLSQGESDFTLPLGGSSEARGG